MKKVFIAAALAAMIVSCGSKGNKSAEMIAESESDSLFAVNDSTAIIYQLVSAAPGHEKTNFVAEGDSALTMVGKDFKKAISKLNYTLKKKL